MKRAAFFVIIAMMATLLIACPNPSPSDSAVSCDTVPADTVADTTQMDGKRYARLDEADYERVAAELGIDEFATTLTVSRFKNSAKIFHEGENLPGFQKIDFKKKDGFNRSIVLSKELGLYRQDYCGCEFSLRDRRCGDS